MERGRECKKRDMERGEERGEEGPGVRKKGERSERCGQGERNLEALVGNFFRRSIVLRQKSLEGWGGRGRRWGAEDRDEIEAG
jgi:hypothetical protein